MFDQTCFNRVVTHVNISVMFGHQTMCNEIWLPNISHLDRPLSVRLISYSTVQSCNLQNYRK